MSKRKQTKQQEVKITDSIAGAEYANMMQVLHNKDEINFLFAHILAPTGKIVSKITTSPGHFKKMIEVMRETLDAYENKYGKIDSSNNHKNKNGRLGF